LRVLYLSPTGQIGGAETSLLAVLASVREAEPTWPLQVVMATDGPLGPAVASLGATPAILPFPQALKRLGEHGATFGHHYLRLAAQLGRASSAVASYVHELRRVIRAFQPDVIHTNGLKMHLLAAWAAGSIPVVWHLHDYLGPRPFTARLIRWNVSRCAALVANSNSVAEDARLVVGPGVKVVPIHNAVDLDRFSPAGDRADLDALAGLAPALEGTIRIGLLATFARWKGHEVFLRAIAALVQERPVRAYIIGDALYETDGSQYSRSELRAIVHALGLSDRVGLTGFVPRPESALRALDIVVHASTAPEPFGLVIAEAMACARPVIVSRAGGAAELVTDRRDALTHAPGEVDELTARLRELVADPTLRERLGAAGRETAQRDFDSARLARELLPLYRSAAAAA
jgi:glycosyltransferase involved in cell wall biosynthesis